MGNLTTSGAATFKAGENMPKTIPEEAWVTWISGAESFINVATRKNWSDDFANLNDDVKNVLDDTASSLVSTNAIAYEMGGYNTRGEAESMVNIQRDNYLRNIQFLRDIKQQTFIDGA